MYIAADCGPPKAYAFADCVVLLDARTFEFLRALTFREVIPAVNGTDEAIRCISIEPGMRLVRSLIQFLD